MYRVEISRISVIEGHMSRYVVSYPGLPMFFNVENMSWEGLGTRL
jgi:hypothetical protein